MLYYISDTHFGDKGQLYLQKRPFSSVEEMDEEIIKRWNEKVRRYDDVYIIGDLISHQKCSFSSYLRRLNGQKHLIVGNHDYNLLKDKKALDYFVSVDDYKVIRDNGRLVVLSHYPFVEWNGYYKGVIHVYGHVHSNSVTAPILKAEEKSYNAGCMINNYYPVTLEELQENNKVWKEN